MDTAQKFEPILIAPQDSHEVKLRAMRTNSLGSLYYFIKNTLRRKRLVDHLHKPWCQSLERDHIKDVHEQPRDHFKTTIYSEGFPMWRSLPFTNEDADTFYKLGYNDDFIAFLKRVHRRDARNILISENITNAAKLGSRISGHYESNPLFRVLFPEILPDSACTWSNYSLHHKREKGGAPHGEGTYDFLGVGSALQSRHYNGILVEDDLVGRKAIESISIMDKTIDYHRLLVGAFENPDSSDHENDELIAGNRWGYTDLCSHIREHEPEFRIVTHSALGGCCDAHPPNQPIFPEEFSFEKLLRWRNRLGNYHFSCQFLNNPSAPENADFREEWLGSFTLEAPNEANAWKERIHHEVKDGIVKPSFPRQHLNLAMAVDPNHSGNAGLGRCRHAIVVVGLSAQGDYYLLDCWAQAASYDTFYGKIFEMANKWHLTKFGLETVAAQKYIGHHIKQMCQLKSRTMRIIELKGEVEGPDGELTRKKEWRIRNVLAPLFEQGRFYTQRRFQDFLGEYTGFPKAQFVDILDALAYVPQLLRTPFSYEQDLMMRHNNQLGARRVNAPYNVAVH